MRKIKINEQQANMLKGIDKTKVLKVTQEQYNKILEVESLLESTENTTQWRKELSPAAAKEFNKTKIPGIRESESEDSIDLYESFINELYGMNEGTEKKYEKLSKLMEVAGLINNGRIVKEKFQGNKDMVREAVSIALDEMGNGCNEYKAMDLMEEALNLKKKYQNPEDMFKNLLADKIGKIRDSRVQFLYGEGKYKAAWNAYRASGEVVTEEEEIGAEEMPKGIVGLDILKYAPASKLKVSNKDDKTEISKINLPIIDKDGHTMIISQNQITGFENVNLRTSNKWTNGYIDNFKRYHNEEPIFIVAPRNSKLDFDVINPKYIEHIKKYNSGMADEAVEETTVAGASSGGGSSGPFVAGGLGMVNRNQPNVAKELVGEGELTEQGIANSGQYDTPGLEDINMKGDTPRGSGPTWKKPTIAGGTEVKIKDKCNKFPYCNQGPEAIAEIAKRTGRDIKEINEIIKNFKQK